MKPAWEAKPLCRANSTVSWTAAWSGMRSSQKIWYRPSRKRFCSMGFWARASVLRRDQPVQGGLPADDAIGQLLAEVAVGGRKPRLGQFRLEPVFHKTPARTPLEDAHCNFSWFFVAHDL